jgi:hypothetical protein
MIDMVQSEDRAWVFSTVRFQEDDC